MYKETDEEIINTAIDILKERLQNASNVISVTEDVHKLLRLQFARLEHEVFGVLLLDTHGRLIHNEVLFRGTLLHTTVYPREVVKLALKHNANKIIFYHNHPAGSVDPTEADKVTTKTLQDILRVIDVEVVDHVIVAGNKCFSFQEQGLLED